MKLFSGEKPPDGFEKLTSIKGKEWIRLPSIIYAVSMMSGLIMILSEEAFGQYRTPHLVSALCAR